MRIFFSVSLLVNACGRLDIRIQKCTLIFSKYRTARSIGDNFVWRLAYFDYNSWLFLFPISCKYILDGHVSSVTSLTHSRDGKSLISGGRDQVINVWSVSNGERLKTLPVYEVCD